MVKPNERHSNDSSEMLAVAGSIESWSGCELPKKVDQCLRRAMDRLKDGATPMSMMASAEEINLSLFRLQGALLESRADEEAPLYKRTLAKLERDWLGHLQRSDRQHHPRTDARPVS